MPRAASGRAEAQRERQRRYRMRLRSCGKPEASVVDVAISAAASAMVEATRRAHETARGMARQRRETLRSRLVDGALEGPEAEAAFAELKRKPSLIAAPVISVHEHMRRLLRGAVSILVSRGYDSASAQEMVVRRLSRGGDARELDEIILASGLKPSPNSMS